MDGVPVEVQGEHDRSQLRESAEKPQIQAVVSEIRCVGTGCCILHSVFYNESLSDD